MGNTHHFQGPVGLDGARLGNPGPSPYLKVLHLITAAQPMILSRKRTYRVTGSKDWKADISSLGGHRATTLQKALEMRTGGRRPFPGRGKASR